MFECPLEGAVSAHPAAKLRGLRHVLQGESDAYMGCQEFDLGIATLTRRGLVYDVLILERQLPVASALVDWYPEQIFVLDHVAKPRIAPGEKLARTRAAAPDIVRNFGQGHRNGRRGVDARATVALFRDRDGGVWARPTAFWQRLAGLFGGRRVYA